MTRIASDCGRNIYFVSDSLKQIVTLNQDRIKVCRTSLTTNNLFLFSLLIWVFGY
jgi:hypothetical protein